MKIIYLLAILPLVASCSKEEKKPTICVALDPVTVGAFNFKSGSYWIYRDSVSGGLDSFVVISYDTDLQGNFPGSKPGTSCYSKIQILVDIHHKSLPAKSVSRLEWWLMGNSAFLFSDSINLNNNPFVKVPLAKDDIWKYFVDSGKIDTIFQDYTVAGNTYSNVAKINHKHAYNKSYDDIYYFKDSIGIVKMRLKRFHYSDTAIIDSTLHDYELIRYHINQ